jgi:hypothetical protein
VVRIFLRKEIQDFTRSIRNDHQQINGKHVIAQTDSESDVATDSIRLHFEREGSRFGSIAHSRGHVTLHQNQQASAGKVKNNGTGGRHRYLGTTRGEKYWITAGKEDPILAGMSGDAHYPGEIIPK